MLGEPALVLEIEGNQTKPRDPAGLYINTTARHAPASVISHSGTSAVFTSRYPIIAASHARSSFFEFRVVVEPGFVGDPFQLKGLATVTANTINAGLTRSSQVGRSSRFESQGMVFSRSIYPDAVSLGVCATEPRKSLRLLVNAICVSSIHESAVSRIKQSQISLLAAEQSHPINLAMRVLPELVFGRSDGYGAPWTGAGTEQGVLNISLEDVTSLYRRWRSSGPMKLLAVGPASEEKLLALTTDAFSELFQHRESSHVVLPSVFTSLTRSRIVVASRPRSLQTAIFAAVSISPKTATQMEALLLADAIFGSAFSSRLNLTLREARQWTYGVHTNLLLGRQSCLWLAYAQVRTNVTAAAMQEIENIWRGLADERPPSPLELRRAKFYIISQLSRQYESSAEIASALERLLLYDLPRWYYSELPERIERLSVEDVALAYQTAVSQSNLQWLLVGHEESLFSNLACAGYTSVTCM